MDAERGNKKMKDKIRIERRGTKARGYILVAFLIKNIPNRYPHWFESLIMIADTKDQMTTRLWPWTRKGVLFE